jgi:superfamily I DNA/RNA helicase
MPPEIMATREQWALVSELLAGGDISRVVVVGDDLQSIYAFTGAEVRNIQRFELAAGLTVGDATYKLSTNFRSGRTILELANHIAREVHPENSQDEPKVLSARPCSASASATHLRAWSWPSPTPR